MPDIGHRGLGELLVKDNLDGTFTLYTRLLGVDGGITMNVENVDFAALGLPTDAAWDGSAASASLISVAKLLESKTEAVRSAVAALRSAHSIDDIVTAVGLLATDAHFQSYVSANHTDLAAITTALGSGPAVGGVTGGVLSTEVQFPYNAAAYANGQVMSGLITISSALRAGVLSGILQDVRFGFVGTQAIPLWLYAFSGALAGGTVTTDRATFMPVTTDRQLILPGFPIQLSPVYTVPGAAGITGLTAAVIHAGGGGANYQVDDILTVAGGTALEAAQVRVLTLSGSAVATVAVELGGQYSVNPTTSANAVTGGHGTSCTLDLTLSQLVQTHYGASNLGRRIISADTSVRFALIAGDTLTPNQRRGHYLTVGLLPD